MNRPGLFLVAVAWPWIRRNVLLLLAIAIFAIACLAGCTPAPAVLVKPQPVEVTKYVRAPIPAALLRPCTVTAPDPACWSGTVRAYCNGQLAVMLADALAALGACDADKTALRAIAPEPTP